MSFLYVRTAKTGSSTVNDWCGPNIVATNNIKFLNYDKNKELIEEAVANRHTLFTTVRNPFTRAVSCWQECIRSNWLAKDTSFEDYFDLDYKKVSEHCYTHNCPISEYLSPYLGKVKLIIKMEELSNSLRKMEINYNIPERRIGFFNRNAYAKNFDYRGFYNYKRIKLVLDRFYVDFETFNYSKSIVDI